MIASLLIALREGLEAALIIGIVMGYLRQFENRTAIQYAWLGVLSAVLMSFALGLGIHSVGAELEGKSEAIFEGTVMLLAAGMLTWMIFWMRTHAKTLKSEIEKHLSEVSNQRNYLGIAGVTFLAVFREGVETALFLPAAAFKSDALATLGGTFIGLSLAALIGYLLFTSTLRFNLRMFFNITSAFLLVFAAVMVVSGIHELEEAGFIHSLLSNEIIEPIIVCGLYVSVILGGLWWQRRQITVQSETFGES